MNTKTDYQSLYVSLDEHRRDKNLAWRKLAMEITVSVKVFTCLRKGMRPKENELLKVCEWFGVNPSLFNLSSQSNPL